MAPLTSGWVKLHSDLRVCVVGGGWRGEGEGADAQAGSDMRGGGGGEPVCAAAVCSLDGVEVLL